MISSNSRFITARHSALLTILLRVEELESVSDVGSREASGELLGDPVDMGEGEAAGWLVVEVVEAAGGRTGGTMGATGASRNGFLLLLGEVKGLDLPMVANFGPVAWLVVSDCDWGGEMGEVEEVEEVVVVVEVVMVVMVVGGTKFGTKGFVLVSPLLAVSGARLVAAGTAGAPAELRKLLEKRVSRWRPARPFSEK